MSAVEAQKRRNYWLRQMQRWHWISAAVCLSAMLLFSITGITLNHAGQISATPQVTTLSAKLPAPFLAQITRTADAKKAPLML